MKPEVVAGRSAEVFAVADPRSRGREGLAPSPWPHRSHQSTRHSVAAVVGRRRSSGEFSLVSVSTGLRLTLRKRASLKSCLRARSRDVDLVLTVHDLIAWTSVSETLSGSAVKVLGAIDHGPFAGRGS